MIIGIDRGNAFTKISNFYNKKSFSIRSTVQRLDNDFSVYGIKTEGLPITINDRHYLIGSDGEHSTNLLKSQHNTTKILVYTAIACNISNEKFEEIHLVIGLPIGKYQNQKQQMIALLQNNNIIHCVVNNQKREFQIKNVETYPEGAGAYIIESKKNPIIKKKNILLVDIGGLSVDVVQFNKGRIYKYTTYELGIMPLLNKIANIINMKYSTKFTLWDMDTILEEGLYINGEPLNDIEIHSYLKQHSKKIIGQLTLDYDILGIHQVLFTGGGANKLFPYLSKKIKNSVLLTNNFYANACGFQEVAEVLYGKYKY